MFGVLRLIELRAFRDLCFRMFRRVLRLTSSGPAPAAPRINKGVLPTLLYLGIAMLFAMLVSGTAAMGLEFIAYRPLRENGNARGLTLITAIGSMSFVP